MSFNIHSVVCNAFFEFVEYKPLGIIKESRKKAREMSNDDLDTHLNFQYRIMSSFLNQAPFQKAFPFLYFHSLWVL